jgi:hypothetical protein
MAEGKTSLSENGLKIIPFFSSDERKRSGPDLIRHPGCAGGIGRSFQISFDSD